ncbi:MAG: choice-of-anchor tandem repeat GloVer-containing protein, partial [Capsulimonadaceae bacterium]
MMNEFRSWHRWATLVAVLALCLIPAAKSFGQTLVDLYDFNPYPNGNVLSVPIPGSDGYFYGTTMFFGAYNDGTIYKATQQGVLTTVHSFSGPDGACPSGGLVQGADGSFYGTTGAGGAGGYGTIFRLTPSGVLTTLYSFSGPDGDDPSSLMQASDGNFYGTTQGGGTYGTVFRITPIGALTTLYSFSGPDGAWPFNFDGPLAQGSDGNFYGTTYFGGTYGYGTVFKITPDGVLTSLYSFTGQADGGGYPRSGVVQGIDGNFYGTAGNTVFKITPGG